MKKSLFFMSKTTLISINAFKWCKVLSLNSCLVVVVVAKYVIFSHFQTQAAAAHQVSASTKLLVKAKICFSKY